MKIRMLRVWVLCCMVLLAACGSSPPVLTTDDAVTIASDAYDRRMAGKTDEAVALLKAGLKTQPEAAVLHYELSRAYLYLLELEPMQREAEAAVAAEPERADYHYYAAIASVYALIDAAHHGKQEHVEAMGHRILGHLEAALQIDPDDHRARSLLVQQTVEMAPDVGIEAGDPMPHVLYLEEHDPILGAKARCCFVDEKEQIAIWTRILEEHPDDPRAQVEAAEGLIIAGKLIDAKRCLDRAIEADPENCYGTLRLGLAYAMKNDLIHAITVTREFLEMEPPVPLKAFALARLAVLQRRAGNMDRAEELRTEATAVDPHAWFTVMPPPREIFTPVVASR